MFTNEQKRIKVSKPHKKRGMKDVKAEEIKPAEKPAEEAPVEQVNAAPAENKQ